MTLTIRPAVPDDVELLCRLNEPVHELHVKAYPQFFKPYAITDEMRNFFHVRLTDPTWAGFIAELDEEPVGYVLLQTLRRPENVFVYAMDYISVDQLSVMPEHQRKGIGRALMEAVYTFARANGLSYLVLNVWVFNQDAIGFYERLGFNFRDTRMELTLQP
ncbi:MAG: GNAT family N-acetyltransferase [Anaerolineae bacterium]